MRLPVTWLPVINLLFGFGGGISVVLMPQVRVLFASAPVGRAVSAVNLFSFTGIFVSQWAMGARINRWAQDAAYKTALIVSATFTLAALIGYWPLVRKSG